MATFSVSFTYTYPSFFFLMLTLQNEHIFSWNMYWAFTLSTIKCFKLSRDGILSNSNLCAGFLLGQSWPSAFGIVGKMKSDVSVVTSQVTDITTRTWYVKEPLGILPLYICKKCTFLTNSFLCHPCYGVLVNLLIFDASCGQLSVVWVKSLTWAPKFALNL